MTKPFIHLKYLPFVNAVYGSTSRWFCDKHKEMQWFNLCPSQVESQEVEQTEAD